MNLVRSADNRRGTMLPFRVRSPLVCSLFVASLVACGTGAGPGPDAGNDVTAADGRGTDSGVRDASAGDASLRDGPSADAPTTDASDVPSDAGPRQAAMSVGPAGGRLSLDGASIDIPAGALGSTQVVTITLGGGPPAGYTAASSVYVFGPDGLVFTQPATVTLPFQGNPNPAVIQWSNVAGTGFDPLPTTTSGSAASAQVTHFSQGFVGYPTAPPTSDPRRYRLSGTDVNSCALRANGTVSCWGFDPNGELGDGTSGSTTPRTPVDAVGLTDAVSISSDGSSTCALRAGGTVACWGNVYRPAGTPPVTTPTDVPGLDHVVQIEGGGDDFCALRDDGTVWCFGLDRFGQFGDGATTPSTTWVQAAGITDATELATGLWNNCVLHAGGTVSCWGYGEDGSLGNGTTDDSFTPITVPGLANVVELAGGADGYCARLPGGEVDCWGYDDNGRGNYVLSPTAIPAMAGASSIVLDKQYELGRIAALFPDGSVKYFDIGPTQPAMTVPGLPVDVVQIGLSSDALCALTASEQVWCWGQNQYGSVGDGTMMQPTTAFHVAGF